MRGIALATALCFATASGLAHADATGGPRVADVPKLRGQLSAARVRRNLGWALALTGIVLLGAGSVLLGYSAADQKTAGPATFEDAVGFAVGGGGMMLIGLVIAIPGAVLALRNQSTMTDVEWRLGAARATAFVAPSATGATAGATIRF